MGLVGRDSSFMITFSPLDALEVIPFSNLRQMLYHFTWLNLLFQLNVESGSVHPTRSP